MSIKLVAKRIPDNIRSEILLTVDDIIYHAIPVKENPQMKILLKIWKEFVEPERNINCPICVQEIHTNFKQMKSYLVELENEYQKLKNL